MSSTHSDNHSKSTVSIVRCEDYTPSNVLKSVRQAIDLLGGIETFIEPGQSVLVKPNLLAAHPPDSAVCTHPAVVESIISLATVAGGRCSIGDSPCITAETPEGFERLIETSGMSDVARRTGASVIRFDDSGSEKDIPGAKIFRRVELADALNSADILVNIAKFKTHELTLLTGAVKNLFGCVPGRRKIEFHLQAGRDPEVFAQVLVDVLRGVRPTLSVIDGVVGMDGQGPAAGRRRNFGLIMASTDPVALDAVACMTADVDPMTIPMLRLAAEQGVGIADPQRITIVGLQPEEVRITDFMLPARGDAASRVPKPVYKLLRNQLVRSPVFIRAKCTECRSCVDVCPVDAISGDDDRLSINYSDCIRCYCCQEVCPEEAISLRTGRLYGLVKTMVEIRGKIKRFIKREGSSS